MRPHGNKLVTKGNADSYPCVAAHLDTAHPIIDFFSVKRLLFSQAFPPGDRPDSLPGNRRFFPQWVKPPASVPGIPRRTRHKIRPQSKPKTPMRSTTLPFTLITALLAMLAFTPDARK